MIVRFLGTVVSWLVIWIVAWRVFYGPMAKRNVDYIDRFVVTCAYFFLWSILIVFLFRKTFASVAGSVAPVHVVVVASVVLAQVWFYHIAIRHLRRPHRLIRTNPREMFLRMDYRYLVSKSAEVMFQQVMIVLLVLTAWRQTGQLAATMIVFAVVFALAHLPLLALFGERAGFFARLYMLAALASAVVFPVVILKVNLGFVFTYVVHTMFFTLLGLWFWWRHTRAGSA